MNAQEVYKQLRRDFILPGITDLDWASRMPELQQYLHPEFIKTGMGLVCDLQSA